MLFSSQKWFCNTCGKEMFSSPCNAMIAGHRSGYKVCSTECSVEMQWRDTLSIMGKTYRPRESPDGAMQSGGTSR